MFPKTPSVAPLRRNTSLLIPVSSCVAEFVLPHPEDAGGVQAGLVRDQRGLVRLSVLSTE